MSGCTNYDCPVGCPDEHALPIGEGPPIDCGTFHDPPMDDEIIAEAVARAHRLAAERDGRPPWAWAALPGLEWQWRNYETVGRCLSWARGNSYRLYEDFACAEPWLTSDRCPDCREVEVGPVAK